jgi:hypothetical protein
MTEAKHRGAEDERSSPASVDSGPLRCAAPRGPAPIDTAWSTFLHGHANPTLDALMVA